MKRTLILAAIAFAIAPFAYASTVTGTITTGVSTSLPDGVVVAAPLASPNAGVYSSTQTVTLSADGSSSIAYTTDGSTPDCATSTIYANPITVSSSEVITAIACYPNGVKSSSAAFQYAINPPSTPSGGGGGSSGGGGGGSVSIPSTTTPTTGSGDTNDDGVVNIFDFNTVVAHWGETVTGGASMGDLNGDGVVNILDFNILIMNWTV